MTKVTDTQSILLSTASQREGGSLYPLPTTLIAPKPALAKSIAALLARGLLRSARLTTPPASRGPMAICATACSLPRPG